MNLKKILKNKIDDKNINKILSDILNNKPKLEDAISISIKYEMPLHPHYLFYWNEITIQELIPILESLTIANVNKGTMLLNFNTELKRTFELIGAEHKLTEINKQKYIQIKNTEHHKLLANFGCIADLKHPQEYISYLNNLIKKVEKYIKSSSKNITTTSFLSTLTSYEIKDKGLFYIGARMGRPEKSKPRDSELDANGLFKLENTSRILNLDNEKIQNTLFNKITEISKEDLKYYLSNIKNIKGLKYLKNKEKINEHLFKGLLRSKYDLKVNKDGTIRYDMTEMGITHFKPIEIGTSIERLKELGYKKDNLGKELKDENQLIEILPQDIILPDYEGLPEYLSSKFIIAVGNFIDELLIKLFKKEPYYNFKTKNDTIGHLVIGIAPHISSGIIGRIIGYNKGQVCFAHPLWHAAQRRNLDGDETSIILLMDGLLNFSKKLLPNTRGGSMDTPLTITSNLQIDQVDDEVYGMDIDEFYPKEFYDKCTKYSNPNEVLNIKTIKNILTSFDSSENKLSFTHSVKNINNTNLISAYKTIESMSDKIKQQIDLAEKIRAVDKLKAIEDLIEKHLLKDTNSNFIKFSEQKFRCTGCNTIFDFVPLSGKCNRCYKNSIILTIPYGAIIKYLKIAKELSEKYNIKQETKNKVTYMENKINQVFGMK